MKATRIFAAAASAALLSACAVDAGEPLTGSDPAERETATSAPAEPDGRTIAVVDFAYEPAKLEVEPGTTVTWVNEDDILHTATSGKPRAQGVPGVSEGNDARPDGLFDGPLDEAGSRFSFVFAEPGTYSYYCAIHAGMKGEVVVRG
ncbi:MAG TPA: plastocyanin/azurin family copper-binding protein [Actinomycetota bacterium]|jgi:plastocyanin|nr:plastocyanin/azurin family copper-binding protein [Actinomycetota bacterium]